MNTVPQRLQVVHQVLKFAIALTDLQKAEETAQACDIA